MKTFICNTVGGYDFGKKIAIICENKAAARYVIKRHLRKNGISDGGDLQDCEIKEARDEST